ncbi:MAG TPA: UDP-glucose/GDP-mannose dehydrogenase family protein, partial [Clostridia bacterium]|nr:UDP-glucose/GDP-mannose dehydrogenase family protein [Clostridia bacterium]
LGQVEAAAREIGWRVQDVADLLVVIKSTVPIGTTRHIHNMIKKELKKRGAVTQLTVVFNPEFLREGASLFDALYPDRIIIGVEEQAKADRLFQLYRSICLQDFLPPACISQPQKRKLPPFIKTTPISAELIKYAANAFLAMKVSFINEFAGLSEQVGADINEIAVGIGLDERIGQRYLLAGAGWGGSCFGKDIKALLNTASQYDYEMYLVEATIKANRRQQNSIVKKLEKQLQVIQGKTISILGISFKPDTDDVRDAPFLHIAQELTGLGARVKAYDPVAIPTCSAKYPTLKVTYCNTPLLAAENSDALLILTEWEEFKHLDYKTLGQKMHQKILLDGRNMLDRETLKKAGFTYIGVGR